ncbi:MAG TPA: hypothetical protein VFQ79_07870 [Bryobacteraceae bacterium]|nr:hypothetical protein [Bryobacteraceae bacterium]
MSRPTAPRFSIQLDRERHLCFDFYAQWKFEDQMGRPFFSTFLPLAKALQAADITQISSKDLVALLWCGLVHEDPCLSMEDVAYMLHLGNIQEVMGSIVQAQVAAAARNEDLPERPPEAQPAQ